MADHGVLLRSAVAAKDVGSWNRYAMSSASAVDNGNVFNLLTENTAGTSGYDEVWDVTYPVTGSLTELWMACSQRANLTVDGTLVYAGLNDDPKRFYNPAGYVLDAYKPAKGDVIVLTADAYSGVVSASSVFLNATDSTLKLTVGSVQSATALSYKLIGTTYVSIGSGIFDTQRKTAYKFQCIANS